MSLLGNFVSTGDNGFYRAIGTNDPVGFDYPLTISAWIKPGNSTVSANTIFQLIDSSVAATVAGDRFVWSGSTLGVTLAGSWTGTATAVGNIDCKRYRWSHVAASVIASNNRDVFVNGVYAGGSSVDVTRDGYTLDYICIGGQMTSATPLLTSSFDGHLAHVALWTGVSLSVGEIRQLASGQSPLRVRAANLALYAPMTGGNFGPYGGGRGPDDIAPRRVTMSRFIEEGGSFEFRPAHDEPPLWSPSRFGARVASWQTVAAAANDIIFTAAPARTFAARRRR